MGIIRESVARAMNEKKVVEPAVEEKAPKTIEFNKEDAPETETETETETNAESESTQEPDAIGADANGGTVKQEEASADATNNKEDAPNVPETAGTEHKRKAGRPKKENKK